VQPESSLAFAAVRARYVVLLWLYPWILLLLPALNDRLLAFGAGWPWYWWSTAYTWLHDGLFLGVLALLAVLVWRLPIDACWGRPPTRPEVIGGLHLTAFVFIASLALTYLTFYPLSLASPDFVQWWYIDGYFPLLYYDSGVYPFLPNLLSLVSLCVVGPALEEIAFRGIILPRWTLKWGLPVGVLASSALFGVVHADPPGAFLFGVAMSVLYLKSQSLTLPILCHGLYNLAVWLMEVQYIVSNGPEHYYTLEEFQEGWPWGAGAAVIAMLWVALYMRRPKSDIRWKFPVS